MSSSEGNAGRTDCVYCSVSERSWASSCWETLALLKLAEGVVVLVRLLLCGGSWRGEEQG